jgi:hypothetical protein
MVAPIVIVWREPRTNFYLNDPRGEVGRYLLKKGKKVQAAARSQVGKSTGRLAASIHIRQHRLARKQFMTIGSSLPHARMVHQGTKPHLIRPKDRRRTGQKGVLIFQDRQAGRIVFSHMVKHPGTRANPYLTRNLRLVR